MASSTEEGWAPPAVLIDRNGKVMGAINHRQPNNWGRWGELDELGTVNFITPERIVAAASLIRTGKVVSCAIPLDPSGPVYPGRANVFHAFTYTGTDYAAGAPIRDQLGHYHGTDDVLFMPLQGSTQWDGLAHAGSHDMLYNGFWIGNVDAHSGARRCSIHQLRDRLQGRGVLLDLAARTQAGRLLPGHAITSAELDACASDQGVEVRSGDILLVRTGHVPHFYALEDKSSFWTSGAPGLSIETVEWIYRKEIGALAMDNIAIEVEPFEQPCEHPFPLHGRLIRDLGLTLGEIWWLDRLADACREEGRWEFFLSAPPLNVTNAVGSPINPIAIF